jgi:SAM-dependent methyltransferase
MPDLNHDYLALQAQKLGGRALDFGCGHANVVRLLRARGVDAYGADVFFGGMDWTNGPHDLVEANIVRTITDGRLPFDDGFFDTVVSDQVIEHVDDLELAISEMTRVLAPSGRMYHQYPTLEIVREAHTGVPWSHRVPARVRVPYLRVARDLRVARSVSPEDRSATEYGRRLSHYIDAYCHYRKRAEIEAAFARRGFRLVHREAEYCRFRAAGRPRLREPIERLPGLAGAAFRRLGFDCVELERVTTAR